MRKALTPVLLLLLVLAGLPTATAEEVCTPRLLVLSAYPGEIDALLTAADISHEEEVEGRRFFVGQLAGRDVVLGLTGIGLVKATNTTQTALDHFRCGDSPQITGIAFSGVSGGPYIGDVVIPDRWSDDDGATWLYADERMLAVAAEVAGHVELTDEVPAGDALCVGHDPRIIHTVTLEHDPEIRFGGDGRSSDPFDGRDFPCFPGGGDVFGCEPCRADPRTPDLASLPEQIAPFVDPDFFFGYFEWEDPSEHTWVAADMESAAMARVAVTEDVPFVVFRGVSDGQGDPLHLPGFPFQFFYYRQVAADNAARMALAFITAWDPADSDAVSPG